MKKIEALTPEQHAELPAFRERWRAVGLSTSPINEESARSAVRILYQAGGCEPPKAVITLASPMACLIARGICERLLNEKLRGQLGDQLWDQLRGQLGDQLGDQLWDQLRGQLRGQLWDQLRGQLGGQLGGQLWDQLRGQLYVDPYFIGGQDAYWLSFAEFGEKIGARYSARTKEFFEAYRGYALTCGWMFAFKPMAFVSDRPAEIHFDAQRRLHSPDGMAVRFRDGWGVHAWHGLRVPARLIETPDFDAGAIENESNAEFRRVLLEREYGGRTGFELYAEQRNAKVIAEDISHGFPRRLLEVNVRDQRIRVIEVINGSLEPDGSRRKFHLGAMRGETPAEAIAASYGIAPAHYREAVRS